jgi:hypothetical protein
MFHSGNNRQSPLAPLPGQPAPRFYDCGEALRTRHSRFLAIPTEKGFMQVSLNKSYASFLPVP